MANTVQFTPGAVRQSADTPIKPESRGRVVVVIDRSEARSLERLSGRVLGRRARDSEFEFRLERDGFARITTKVYHKGLVLL